jgi:hypothetical protein
MTARRTGQWLGLGWTRIIEVDIKKRKKGRREKTMSGRQKSKEKDDG